MHIHRARLFLSTLREKERVETKIQKQRGRENMQFRKIAAIAGSALMAGMTLAGAAMAATNVGNIANLATPPAGATMANFPIFVIGKTAASADVAGAIDIAVRMAAESKTTTTATTTGTSAAVTGLERDGISIGTSSTSILSTSNGVGTAFPATNLTNIHFDGLKKSSVRWSGDSSDYNYKEQVDVSGINVRHSLTENYINGTEKLVVGTSGAIKYEYVFDTTFNFTTKDGSKGTLISPQYAYPLQITMMGKQFSIVGASSDSLLMMSGNTGTARKDASSSAGVASSDGAYTAYVTAGVNAAWVTVELKDKTGNLVGTKDINSGDTYTFSAANLDVQVTAVKVAGTDPSTNVISADLVVGPTGTTTKTYDGSADVVTTGKSNDAFPGTTRWGIQYKPAAGADDRKIPAGSMIQVVYLPETTEYYVAGQKISLPNSYGDLGFEGFNTNNRG